METIDVPKPKGVRNPDRAAGTLLLAHVRHLHEAEKTLPPKYQSGIFHKAIETEFEAARYVQAVTEAIHDAHDDAVKERARRMAARRKVVEIAAAADQGTARKKRARTKGIKSKRIRGRKGGRRS